MSDEKGLLGSFGSKQLQFVMIIGIVGSLAQTYYPALGVKIGGILGKPLDAVFSTYVMIMWMHFLLGDEKTFSETLKELVPIILLIGVLGSFFKIGVNLNYYLFLILLAPIVGTPIRNFLMKGGWIWWRKEQASGSKEDFFKALLGEGGFKGGDKGGGEGSSSDWGRAASSATGLIVQTADALENLKKKLNELEKAKGFSTDPTKHPAGTPHHGKTVTELADIRKGLIKGAIDELQKSIDHLKSYFEGEKTLGLKNEHTKKELDKAKKSLKEAKELIK